jgi:hypothetical protein
MYWLTEDALLTCAHEAGHVSVVPTQTLVTINARRVLVERDPERRPIASCPWTSPAQKPCTNTLEVKEGYSPDIRIDGRRVCLDTVTGLTDGTPPGTFKYQVRRAGQELVQQQ